MRIVTDVDAIFDRQRLTEEKPAVVAHDNTNLDARISLIISDITGQNDR